MHLRYAVDFRSGTLLNAFMPCREHLRIVRSLRWGCDGLVRDGDNPFGFFADAACDIAIDAGADACNKS